MIDIGLVKAINAGNCVPIIGAGLSREIGLESWEEIASKSIKFAESQLTNFNPSKALLLLNKKKYAEVFSEVLSADNENKFLEWLGSHFEGNIPISNNSIYDIISNWPFNFYLTTNYDHAIVKYLRARNLSFFEKLNFKEDFDLLRVGSKNLIFKIHGDFSNSTSLVLSKSQYDTYQTSDQKKYWREKLFSVLSIMDVVIIGYSLSDPDFNEQVERAKEISSPDHPIYMFATGLSHEEINHLFTTKNIRVITYENQDGSHKNLQKLLKHYSLFIAKRESPNIGIDYTKSNNNEIASSLFTYTQLRLSDGKNTNLQKTYQALIVEIMNKNSKEGQFITIKILKELLTRRVKAVFDIDPLCFSNAIEELYSSKRIEISSDQGTILLTKYGRDEIQSANQESSLVQDKFKNKCTIFLEELHDGLSNVDCNEIINIIISGLIVAFEKRGIELSRWAFSDYSIDLSDSLDILYVINSQSNKLSKVSLKTPYIELMIDIFTKSSQEYKDYLALLSQGFFVFHSLGYQKDVVSQRELFISGKLWILDSSIIITLLAKHCQDNSYAIDLIVQAQKLGFSFATTERLFTEVKDHLDWAIRRFKDFDSLSPEFILIVKGQAGYKPNLFVEGYIKWAAKNGNPSFSDYISDCLNSNSSENNEKKLRHMISELNIQIKEIEDFQCYSEDLLVIRDTQYFPKIKQRREEALTYRNDNQCIAEAEVLYICEKQNATFLTTSTNLNYIGENRKISWKPEVLYRFLSLFTYAPSDQSNFFASLVQDLRNSGLPIYDQKSVLDFAKPSIRQARLSLEAEKEHFVKALGLEEYINITEKFEKTPDEEKPFYSLQLAFHVAQRSSKRTIEVMDELEKVKNQSISEKDKKILESVKRKRQEKERERKKKNRSKKNRKK